MVALALCRMLESEQSEKGEKVSTWEWEVGKEGGISSDG